MHNLKKFQTKDQFALDSTNLSYKRPEYNSLNDPNLVSYFSSPRRRRLLIQQQLVFYK